MNTINRIKNFILYFLFFFSALFFLLDTTRNPYVIQTVIIYVCITLIAGIVIGMSVVRGEFTVYHKFSVVETAYLIFWLFCVITWFLGIVRFQEFRSAAFSEGAKAITLLTMAGLFTFFMPLYAIRRESTIDKITNTILAAAVIASIYGIFQFSGIELIWPKAINPFNNRCVSTFGNPNFLSSYLVMLIPIVIHKFIYVKDQFYKFVWAVAGIILTTALVCTLTRSSWLGLGISVLIMAYYLIKIKKNISKYLKNIGIVVVVLIIFMAVISPVRKALVQRAQETITINLSNKSIYQRFLIWSSAKDMYLDHPVTGVGWGLFEMFYPFYQSKYLENASFALYRTHANNAHNEVLELLTQTGIIGFGIFIWLLICFVKYVLKGFKNSVRGEKERFEIIAILAGLAGILTDNFLNVSMHFAVPMLIFYFLAGSAVRKSELNMGIAKDRSKAYRCNAIQKTASILVIIILMIISVIQIRFFMADMYYFKGFKILKKSDPRMVTPNLLHIARRSLEKSHKLHRYEVNNVYELGNTYVRLGMHDKAEEAYKAAIKSNPGYDEIYYNLGVIYFQNKDNEKALNEFEKSYNINPRSLQTLYALGNIYISEPKYFERGINVLERSIMFDDKNPIAFNNLGFLYSKIGRKDDSRKMYLKALEIDPNLIEAKNNLILLDNEIK
ncbi:MAG: tetratricopeptide repeat protein [Elusimicrobiota bacterium]